MNSPISFFVAILTISFGLALAPQETHAQTSSDVRAAVGSSAADSLARFYGARSFEPVWIWDGRLTSKAYELRQAVAGLRQHGLKTADYWTPAIENIFRQSLMAPSDAVSAEVALSKTMITIARHIAVGRIAPEKASAEVKFTLREFDRELDIANWISQYSIATIWDAVAPRNAYYQNLRSMLARLHSINDSSPFAGISPYKKTLRVGSRERIVRDLKHRASLMGYRISAWDDRFDQEFSRIVADIQRANLGAATGVLTPQDSVAWEFFSISSARRIQQLEMNLEKARWLPSELESRYILVNLATQRMQVVDPALTNPVLYEQNVVVGRPDRKTPSMREDMEYVVLNPTWTIPPDIYRLDKVPAIQQAARSRGAAGIRNWFLENRMTLLDRNEKPIDPTQFDWISNPPRFGNVLIRQQPGTDNALGTMKFMMPNPYSIYLHDTNQPELLRNDMRLLSSGCIRLQYPRDFAEYLLTTTKWTRAVIDDFVVKPGETRPEETWVRLPNRVTVPVYLISFTANLDNSGVMRFTRDLYKQNAGLLEALQAEGMHR